MQELSLNILDIAQNSVKAGASLVEISIDQDDAGDRLSIAIEDNGCGMTPEQVERVTDPFFTSRTTRKVGLGVPFFKMAAEMAGGSFSISSEPGKGTAVRASFVLGHIDRMPLGDISSTVASLIQCNGEMDFVYSYTRNGNTFSTDTRQLKELLGDVDITSPQIVEFIREYIEENTAAIGGGEI